MLFSKRRSTPDVLIPLLYTVIAPVHDVLAKRVATRARHIALSWLVVQDGECVLELAPGTGLAFHRLVQANPSGQTLGLDRSSAMLRRARRRLSHAAASSWTLRLGDARHTPVEADGADALYAGYLLDQFDRSGQTDVLVEAQRVLRPGGRLVLQHMTHPASPVARGWARLARMAPWILGRCQPIQIEPMLRAVGFTNLRRQYVEEGGFPSEVVYAECPVSSHS